MSHATTVSADALARVIRRHASALARYLPRARRGQVRAVHQARVASRRLREALPVANAVSIIQTRGVRHDVRRLTAALGDVRELDVARHTLDEEARRYGWPFGAVAIVDRHLQAERDRGRESMLPRIDRIDQRKFRVRVEARATGVESSARPDRIEALLTARVRSRARRFVRALHGLGTLYAPEPLHQVRIAGKKLRYSLELARDVARVPLTREIVYLKHLQELLGRLHDLQILSSHVRSVLAQATGSVSTRRGLETMAATFDSECRALHAKFLRKTARAAAMAAQLTRIRSGVAVEAPKTTMARMTVPVTTTRRSIAKRATS